MRQHHLAHAAAADQLADVVAGCWQRDRRDPFALRERVAGLGGGEGIVVRIDHLAMVRHSPHLVGRDDLPQVPGLELEPPARIALP